MAKETRWGLLARDSATPNETIGLSVNNNYIIMITA